MQSQSLLFIFLICLMTGCGSFAPYQSDQSKSFAANVAKAAGINKYDISKEDFYKSTGKSAATLEDVDDFVYTTNKAYMTVSSISSMLTGSMDLNWASNIFSIEQYAKDRQLMLAWLPKGNIKTEEEAWHKLTEIIFNALSESDMPVKIHEKGRMNATLEGKYGSYFFVPLFGEACVEPFKCRLWAKKFELPTEVTMPDFLGGGPGYFFEIDRDDADQYFAFNCISRGDSYWYHTNAKDREKYAEKYLPCANAMNESAIAFSQNMPDWFFMYRPASPELRIGIPHILNKGKPYFFIKP